MLEGMQRLLQSRNELEHHIDHQQKARQLQSPTLQMTPRIVQRTPQVIPVRGWLDR